MLLTVLRTTNATTCGYVDNDLFPRELGGILGSTQILAFDYQVNTAGTLGRLAMAGTSGSQDVVTHVNSAFVTFEDALNYQMLWSKEFYQGVNYASQSLSLVQVIIDLTNNFVYAAIANPPQIMKINGVDGTLIYNNVLLRSGSFDSTSTLHSLGYFSQISTVIAYFSDTSSIDYFIQMSSVDLSSNVVSQSLFQGIANIQSSNSKILKFVWNPVSNIPWAETSGLVNYGSGYQPSNAILSWSPGTTVNGQLYITANFWQNIFPITIGMRASDSSFIRMGCILPNTQLFWSDSTYIDLYFQVSGIGVSYYNLIFGLSPTQTVTCRDVIITTDMRPFIMLDNFDSSVSSCQSSLLEIIGAYGTTTIQVKTTYLHTYQTSINLSVKRTFFGIFADPTIAGGWRFIYSVNGNQVQGRPTRTFNNGFLMKQTLNAAGVSPVITTLDCTTSPNTAATLTLTPFQAISWSTLTPPTAMAASSYTIQRDLASDVDLYDQDLSQYQIFESGCSVPMPPATIPKYVPYIQQTVYYVIGVDTLVNLGLKSYPIIQNSSMSLLSACQLQGLAYEISMKSNTALPRFIQYNRLTMSIEVNSPQNGATPSEVGTFVLSIIMRDIYSYTATYDFTLIVMDALTIPVNIANCYSESGVIPTPFVYDTLYLTGTQKNIKIQMVVPRTSGNVDCESLLAIEAAYINLATQIEQLPYFITLDTVNRQFIIYLTRLQGVPYVNQHYEIQLSVFIPSMELYTKTINFQIYIVSSQPMSCLYYYYMVAPTIPDYVIQTSTIIPFKPFAISSTQCSSLQIITVPLQSNGLSLPPCVTVNFNSGQINVNPGLCPGPVTYFIRLDALVYDSVYGIKALQNTTQFAITIVGTTTCIGSIDVQISSSPKYFIQVYSNVDTPIALTETFLASLSIQPSTVITPIPAFTTCDATLKTYQAGLYQDNGYVAPAIITQPSITQLSYNVPLSSITSTHVGIYDIRMIGIYLNPDLVSFYNNILSATVFMQYHMYQGSLCQFSSGNPPLPYQYSIMKTAQPLTIQLSPFQLQTDGCIYDKFQYEFSSALTGAMPAFISQNPASISITISTSNTLYNGTYNIQLAGSLNPYLSASLPITIIVTVFEYPNTAAPNFLGSLVTPYVLSIGQDKTYPLPTIKDADGDGFKVQVLYLVNEGPTDILPSFIKYDSSRNLFNLNPTNVSDVGTYDFQIVLTDTNAHPKSRTVPYMVQVQLFDQSTLAALKSKIQPEYIGVQILGISDTGVLIIAFNVSLFNQNLGPSQFNNQSMSLQLKKAFKTDGYNLPWYLFNVTRNELYIQLNFSDPQTISMLSAKDSLVVMFNKSTPLLESQINSTGIALAYLLSMIGSNGSIQASGFQASVYQLSSNIVFKNVVPKQAVAKSSIASLFASYFPYLQNTAIGVLIGNFVLNIFLQEK